MTDISSLIWMKMYLKKTAFLAALRRGRVRVSVVQGRPEDEGSVKDHVAVRGDRWGSEAVPAAPTSRQDSGHFACQADLIDAGSCLSG